MPDQLHFTDSEAANRLIARDPLALLVGFVLDQQVTVQKAFSGPLALEQRLVAFDAASLAAVLARRFGVTAAEPLVPAHPTLGDVDSPEALAAYQAGKRAEKARRRAAASAA